MSAGLLCDAFFFLNLPRLHAKIVGAKHEAAVVTRDTINTGAVHLIPQSIYIVRNDPSPTALSLEICRQRIFVYLLYAVRGHHL